MPGLGIEDYIAFLDESGEDSDRHCIQVVAGVLIPARWLRPAERRWQDFIRDRLGSSSGRTEVKGRDLLKGRGASFHAQERLLSSGAASISVRAAGQQFYRDALEHIARTREVRVMAVGLPTKRPREVYHLWFWMAFAMLTERQRAPRPRLPLTVIDGEDASFRRAHDLTAFRFYRAFPRCQPYVAKGSQWFVGGSVHQDSALHPFVQTADLVAGAARYAICDKAPANSWFHEYLAGPNVAPGRSIDVSPHALERLKTLSPTDTIGSGWRNARIAQLPATSQAGV